MFIGNTRFIVLSFAGLICLCQTIASEAAPTLKKPYTQTEAFIRVWFNIPESEKLEHQNQEKYVRLLLSDEYKISPNEQDKYIPVINAMLENEKINAAYYVYYHAYTAQFGLLFDLYHEIFSFFTAQDIPESSFLIRDVIALQRQKRVDFPYKTVPNLLELWPQQPGFKRWRDTASPLRDYLLSTNLALFANISAMEELESSFYFFIESVSISPANYLDEFFKYWQFDELLDEDGVLYRTKIQDLYNKYMKSETGHMLQIFLPENMVDTYSYVCERFGTPYSQKITETFDKNKSRHNDTLSILQKYRNDPFSIVTTLGENVAKKFGDISPNSANRRTLDTLQARILLVPEFFDPSNNIKIFRFTLTTKETIEQYKKELRVMVRNMLIQQLAKNFWNLQTSLEALYHVL